MIYLIIYIVGYFVSAVYFSVEDFNFYQKKYPRLAEEYRDDNIRDAIFTGVIKAMLWFILLPITIALKYILARKQLLDNLD